MTSGIASAAFEGSSSLVLGLAVRPRATLSPSASTERATRAEGRSDVGASDITVKQGVGGRSSTVPSTGDLPARASSMEIAAAEDAPVRSAKEDRPSTVASTGGVSSQELQLVDIVAQDVSAGGTGGGTPSTVARTGGIPSRTVTKEDTPSTVPSTGDVSAGGEAAEVVADEASALITKEATIGEEGTPSKPPGTRSETDDVAGSGDWFDVSGSATIEERIVAGAEAVVSLASVEAVARGIADAASGAGSG